MNKRLRVSITFAVFAATGGHSFAVSASQAGGESVFFEHHEIAAFSKQVEKAVAEKGARVFIIARQGRPEEELPEGVKYTHAGFGVYSRITLQDGRVIPGYAMYNLYQRSDKPSASHLVIDYPVDFFAGVYELKAGILIPTPELQKRLLDVIFSETYQELHNPRYSVIANPFNSQYQNCTEHTLDLINAAIYKTSAVDKLKRIAAAYYRPQAINVNPLKLMLGSIFAEDVFVSDHSGPVATATFTTIRQYLERYNLLHSAMTVTGEHGS